MTVSLRGILLKELRSVSKRLNSLSGPVLRDTARLSQRYPPIVRAACLQNETAPEKLLNRYEKRFEKREKGSEKRSETRPKNVSPSQAAKNISPALFN